MPPYTKQVCVLGRTTLTSAAYQKPQRYEVATKFLDASTTTEMFQFPKDMAQREVEPNYLNNQRLVRYFEEDWGKIAR
jgi:spermidine synthase